MKAKRARAQGVIGTVEEPSGFLANQAKQIQKQRQEQRLIAAATAKPFVMLNKHTYAWLYEQWKANGGGKLPKCKRCREYTIHWDEPAHVCEGYKPQFVEHTPERKERWEAEREEIRESRRQLKAVMCSVCGEILECPEDAEWHWEQHEGKPEREHYAIDGEPDGDLDGYEDEPEEDYCEGDDDGYDCH
jgi:hypothetical protein